MGRAATIPEVETLTEEIRTSLPNPHVAFPLDSSQVEVGPSEYHRLSQNPVNNIQVFVGDMRGHEAGVL